MPLSDPVDVVIAGAGIVGLAHACEALRRGRSVLVVDRDAHPAGASVRNFGHGCVTAQRGVALDHARITRERWLELGEAAGFWAAPTGAVVVARADDELAVLREFAAARPGEAELLGAGETVARTGMRGRAVSGGLWLAADVRVDPRAAAPALAAWLAAQGVRFAWRTAATGFGPGVLHTARGSVEAGAVVLALGHDVDRLAPGTAERHALRRCTLQMLRIASPGARRVEPAVLSATSLLRYDGFTDCPSLPRLRERLARQQPALLAAGVNLMLTQHPSGDLIAGDTHRYDDTAPPFRDEGLDALLLGELGALLGVERPVVRERWTGVYASAPGGDFLVDAPADGVRIAAVTSGIGMTTAFGFAASVLDGLALPVA